MPRFFESLYHRVMIVLLLLSSSPCPAMHADKNDTNKTPTNTSVSVLIRIARRASKKTANNPCCILCCKSRPRPMLPPPCGRCSKDPNYGICEKCNAVLFVQRDIDHCILCHHPIESSCIIQTFRTRLRQTNREHLLPAHDDDEQKSLSAIRRIYNIPEISTDSPPSYSNSTSYASYEDELPWLETIRISTLHPRRQRTRTRQQTSSRQPRPVPAVLERPYDLYGPEERMPRSESRTGYGRKKNTYGPRHRQLWTVHSPSDELSPF